MSLKAWCLQYVLSQAQLPEENRGLSSTPGTNHTKEEGMIQVVPRRVSVGAIPKARVDLE